MDIKYIVIGSVIIGFVVGFLLGALFQSLFCKVDLSRPHDDYD